jgi:hypothetical protein
MQLPSLREVVLVSHRAPHLTLHRRGASAWMSVDAGPGETLPLSAISGELAVDDVFRDGLEDAERDQPNA